MRDTVDQPVTVKEQENAERNARALMIFDNNLAEDNQQENHKDWME